MTFSSGIITGAVAMLPVVGWLGWRVRHHIAHNRAILRAAEDMTELLDRQIEELTPLATLGRTRRASYDADNARRKASRAKKREAGE